MQDLLSSLHTQQQRQQVSRGGHRGRAHVVDFFFVALLIGRGARHRRAMRTACTGGPAGKDENGRKKSRSVSSVFLYLFRLFSYLQKNIEMGREAGEGVSYPYLRDLVFSRDNPVFFPYL